MWILCTVIVAYGQDGDTLRTPDSTRYYISHASTGIVNYTKDSRSYLLNNLLRFNMVRKNISINTTNGWIYGSQLTGLTNNDFTSALDFNYLKTLQKIYYWGLATYDKSFSLKINNRYQVGLGVGYNMISKSNFSIILSDGFLYEHSLLYDTSAYKTIRNSFRLKYHIVIAKVIVLDGTNFYQPSLFAESDYIIKCTNSLSFKLQSWMSFTLAMTYNRVNISKTENLLCTVGLTFQKTYTHVRH